MTEAPTVSDSHTEVLDVLSQALSDHLGVPANANEIADDTQLGSIEFDGQTFDSMDILVLVLAVEEHFDCDIDDRVLRRDPTWGTLIATIVEQVAAPDVS